MGKLAITGGKPLRKKPFDPWPVYTEKERKALEDVLTNRNWGGQPFPGKHADAIGKKFAKVHTAKYGQFVNTGTVAIQAALKGIDIRPGDEVMVPAYTWEGTVGPVLLVNAVPVFVDVDPESYCMDATKIESLLTPKTRAILPVHLGMRFNSLRSSARSRCASLLGSLAGPLQHTGDLREPGNGLRNLSFSSPNRTASRHRSSCRRAERSGL